ncbi:membrane protein [Marivirga lumbricoides]|uniref:Membrane protein n=2 Tax=Marivirga lumbricoides TaxID=1046115 RepID=A0ABQ1LFF3_9BACT|nr:membrane protein [Marivirga lumbricoides]
MVNKPFLTKLPATMSETEKKSRKVEDAIEKPKSAHEIFMEQVEKGELEHKRPSRGLFMSAIAGGMEVGFTLLLVGIVHTLFYEEISKSYLEVLLAMAYPIGFIFVIIGRSELFTEHTNLAFVPVLNKSATFSSLGRVWTLVFVGNLVGGYLVSLILSLLGPAMDIISYDTFYKLAHKLVDYSFDIILISSIVAGWLMGLVSWLVSSSQETISRIVVIVIVTFLIGIGGLHHSIVGSIEVFAGLLVTDITFAQYGHFQLWSTIGNLIGGVLFVSVLKFSTVKPDKKG